ncbi:7823_t:CDS:10, partial [Ambispora leptoticha]
IKKYIEQTSECGTVPSLSGFVRQNIDLVVRSPPKGTDFNGLDGTWKKRFITTAKILNVKESFALARVMWEAPVRFRPGSIKINAPNWNSIVEMRCEERITVKRRINAYFMYENEHEIIGNQLSKNQENHLASHKPNLQNEESTTIDEKGINAVQKGPSPDIVDYDGLVSKSIAFDDGYKPPHQITSNTYINEISIDENILRISAQSLAKLDESKYFGDFIPHFIKYKESQKKISFRKCTNDDVMDIRGESGFSKFLSVDDYIKLQLKKPKRKVEVSEETTNDGTIKSLSDWINITKNLNILNKNDSEDVVKIKEYLYRVMIPLIESFAKPVPDISAPNTSEHHYWAEFGHLPVRVSKYRKNYGHKHITDKVIDGKSADLLAWIEKTGEEIFVGEQAGPPDLTKLATDSFEK